MKLALLDGVVVTAQPEYDDVVRAARALGRPIREVLADATPPLRRALVGAGADVDGRSDAAGSRARPGRVHAVPMVDHRA